MNLMKRVVPAFLTLLLATGGAIGADTTARKPKDGPGKQNKLIPAGYRLFEEIHGDLNGDGAADYVVIIKATDKKNFERRDEDDPKSELLDRNPLGIMIFFNNGGVYNLALENRKCLDSENEDGGVYFAPELSVSIKKGNLLIHYGHGRYGAWTYTFRYKNNGFVLIGFDYYDRYGCSNTNINCESYEINGRKVEVELAEIETSINFLTQKKLIKTTVHYNDYAAEKTTEKWQNINFKNLRDLKSYDFREYDEDLWKMCGE